MKLFTFKNILLTSSLMTLLACQPGAPVVTVLGEVSGFEISETTQILKSKTSKNIFYISGKCFGSISDIQVSFDNGSTYSPLSQYAESYEKNCSSNGTYSYKINPNNTSVFDIPPTSSFKDFKFRGMSDFGMTVVKNLRRQISSGEIEISAGSSVTTGTLSGTTTAYIFTGRVISSAGITSGTNFIFKGAVRIK